MSCYFDFTGIAVQRRHEHATMYVIVGCLAALVFHSPAPLAPWCEGLPLAVLPSNLTHLTCSTVRMCNRPCRSSPPDPVPPNHDETPTYHTSTFAYCRRPVITCVCCQSNTACTQPSAPGHRCTSTRASSLMGHLLRQGMPEKQASMPSPASRHWPSLTAGMLEL